MDTIYYQPAKISKTSIGFSQTKLGVIIATDCIIIMFGTLQFISGKN